MQPPCLRVRSPRPPSPQVPKLPTQGPPGPQGPKRFKNPLPTVPAPVYDARLATRTRHALRDIFKQFGYVVVTRARGEYLFFLGALALAIGALFIGTGGLLVDCGLYHFYALRRF